ncbi:MAG: AI-2E family transporter [Treponema sp.]|jgi:predicted PurR-regulated permease PerM|nr:AI-2E family transporter [Treponema sp.]
MSDRLEPPADAGAPPERGIPQRPIQNYVLGAILVILVVMVCRLFAPFFTVLLWSILLYTLIGPLHHRITKNMNLSSPSGILVKNILAAFFSLGTIILILVPLSFMISQFFRQIMGLIKTTRDYLNGNPGIVHNSLEYAAALITDLTGGLVEINPEEIQRRIIQLLSAGLQSLLFLSRTVAQDVGSFAVGILFMLFSLFFFYMDGAYLARLAMNSIPIRKEYMAALAGKFKEITRNLFFGYIIVALMQAAVAYIIFSLFRVEGSLVFAGLVLLCSFVPMLGAGLVWIPLGLIRILNGSLFGGALFLVVSGFFISILDNVVRPLFLQNRIQLHPLIIFFSILGGIIAFGFNGLILGPIVVIFFLTVLDMFLSEYNIPTEGR